MRFMILRHGQHWLNQPDDEVLALASVVADDAFDALVEFAFAWDRARQPSDDPLCLAWQRLSAEEIPQD